MLHNKFVVVPTNKASDNVASSFDLQHRSEEC